MVQSSLLALSCLAFVCLAAGQVKQRPDPVPILKQISRQNDDGSYSFGYENGDGSYKIETKYPNGEVQGKYGYVDDSGSLREVEYGASSNRGFEPSGSDINVPPPTLNEVKPGPLADGEEDDGQYREDPSIYDTKEYKNSRPAAAARRPAAIQHSFQSAPTYQQPAKNYQRPAATYQNTAPQTFQYEEPAQYQAPVAQTFQYRQQPQQQTFAEYQQPRYQTFQQPAGRSLQSYQPQYSNYNTQPYSAFYNGHPSVNNFDIGTGSYSISY